MFVAPVLQESHHSSTGTLASVYARQAWLVSAGCTALTVMCLQLCLHPASSAAEQDELLQQMPLSNLFGKQACIQQLKQQQQSRSVSLQNRRPLAQASPAYLVMPHALACNDTAIHFWFAEPTGAWCVAYMLMLCS
jgi:hypothetical protein